MQLLVFENSIPVKFYQDAEFSGLSASGLTRFHCVVTTVGKCVEPYSVFDFFDKFEAKMPGSNASEFVDIPKVLTTVQQYAPSALQMFLGKDAEITATTAHSSITRVVILFGKPLAGYKNAYDRSEAQDETIKQFILSDFKPLMESLFRERVGQMDFFYNSLSLFLNKIDTQVMADLKLALGSLCFIFVFMFVQTGSLWVTCLAMLSVVTSFCGANLIYRVVLDYRYFGAFHVLAVFIILAVGADDTFVFFDTWKLSSHFTYPTLAHRLSNCYRKAGLAMFFTSVTTAVAFGLSAISPFLGISSFGIFSALLVCMNYLSVVTYFPAVVTTYHLYWEAATCLCCRRKKDGGDNNDEDTGAFSEEAFMQGYSAMRFFRGPFFYVDEEKMKFLDEKSNFGAYLKKREQAFRSVNQDRTSHVFIVWGLKKQSLAMCHQTNVTCYGHTVWDNEFDLNQPESQIAVVRMCDTLKSLSEEHAKVLGLRSNIATKEREVDCFIQDMLHFLQEEESRMHVNETTGAKLRVYPKDTVFHFPVGKEEARTIMTYNPHIYKQPLPKWFNRYFEVVVGFWLNNGFRPGQSRYRYKRYYSLLGEVEVPGTTLDVQVEQPGKDPTNKTFFYGTRLAFAAISVNLSISGDNLNYNLGMYMLQAWNHLIGEKMRTMPRLLRRGFQCALGPPEGDGSIKNIWHWMKVQAQLTNSAFVGIIVGLCTALPILLWATGNVIVALLSLMTIIFITFSVIAVIPLMHWKLGVLESLNLVLLVGLAVEFVIHLSEAYARSEHHGRLGRTQDTLSEVGFSVLSGAFSSLGASFFLLLAKIVFLVEFGVFMFCTVGFSILYSLLFFTTVLGIIGPERRFGNVSSVVTWVKYFWERRAKRKRRPPQPWAMAQQKRAATDTSL
ncbi:Protein dispatched [Lamellibrachia satsuma]|nr:Protein dispatched [Lamellibrachia satsuma]